MKRLFRRIGQFFTDDNLFIHNLERIVEVLSKILSLSMIGVILVAVADLMIFLGQELLSERYPIFKDTLFEIFGLFLNILIALELLENITAYLRKHVIQVELVIVTSLIAVARKIIVFDLEKKTGSDLIGLALAIFSLSISYWIVRRTTRQR